MSRTRALQPGEVVDDSIRCNKCLEPLVVTRTKTSRGPGMRRVPMFMTCPKHPWHMGLIPIPNGKEEKDEEA